MDEHYKTPLTTWEMNVPTTQSMTYSREYTAIFFVEFNFLNDTNM